MKEKISSLNEAQIALQEEVKNEWIEIGLRQKLNKEEAEAGVKWMYYASNLKEPEVVFCSGPQDFAKKFTASVGTSVRTSVWTSVWDSVRDSVGTSVRTSVRTSVGTSVRTSVWTSVRTSVRTSVWDSVRDSVGASVRDSVWDSVRDSVWDSVGASVGASVGDSVGASVRDSVRDSVGWTSLAYDAEFGGWYEYWKKIEAITPQEKADKYIGYLRSGAFFVLFFEKVAYVFETPKAVHQDENKRLHSPEGFAIEYHDGSGEYRLHGVKFTEEQFKKSQTASISEIISWEDIDQRSAILRDRPIKELLESCPKTLVDHSDECGGYDLWELVLEGLGKCKVLAYKSWSSEKEYIKFVEPDSKKALETVAKLRHQTVEELRTSNRS